MIVIVPLLILLFSRFYTVMLVLFDGYSLVIFITVFILYPLAANNMNLTFSTFFSRSKFAGEITIFLNVLCYSSFGFFIYAKDENDMSRNLRESLAHFLGIIPQFAFLEAIWRILELDEHEDYLAMD